MGWFRKNAGEYLAEAEYHRARAEVWQNVANQSDKVPAAVIAQIAVDRGYEAKYRALAQQANKEGK